MGLPAPDLTVFLDISPQKAAEERAGYGGERYEKLDMQIRVRGVFERIGVEMRDRWVRLDAGATVDEVSAAIWSAVNPLVDGVHEPVGKLWAE